MEMDSSQERGILQPEVAETTIEDDSLAAEEETPPENFNRTARHDRLTAYRLRIAAILGQCQRVMYLLKIITMLACGWSLFCIFAGWGTFVAAIALLNNLEMGMGFYRETPGLVAQKTELYICRCVFIILMKPIINVIICMLGGDTCKFGSPSNVSSELPLSIAILSFGQLALLKLHKSLYLKNPQANPRY